MQVPQPDIVSTLARIEAKIDILLGHRPSSPPAEASNADLILLNSFTTKQHGIIQLLLRDASNEEIASRLKVAPNTIKTHIAMIARKLGVQRRAAIISTLAPIYERVSTSAYKQASGGLPKDWDQTYDAANPINALVENKGEHHDD